MVRLNEEINWKPQSYRRRDVLEIGCLTQMTGIFSRSRFWGIPLPVWRTEDGKETQVMGSITELKQAIDHAITKGMMQENPLKDFKEGDFFRSQLRHPSILHKKCL